MRPINKGGAPRIYSNYKQARLDLEGRIGAYCSYCEKNLDNSPDVEHVIPKSLEPEGLLDWENFLLGCKNCNQVKGKKLVDRDRVAFPDRENTFLAIVYKGSRIMISEHIDEAAKNATQELINLIGLDRHKDGHNKSTKLDNRYKLREEEWAIATSVKKRINESSGDKEELRNLAVERPKAKGLFSIWMTVFSDDPAMRRKLINSFPGTADCFDINGNPTARAGGKF